MTMAAVCLAVYYNPFNKNCRMIAFMNDIPEDDFLRGMQYVLVEASIQLVSSFCLLAFLKKKLNVDVFRVGRHILMKTPLCFWAISLFSSTYFLGLYVQHLGIDESFAFSWVFDENVTRYIPANAPAGSCQVFNLVDAAVTGNCQMNDTEIVNLCNEHLDLFCVCGTP